MPNKNTTPSSLTGSCRKPRKSIGFPYVGRFSSLVWRCRGENESPDAEGVGDATRGGEAVSIGRRATTSAHSGRFAANSRNFAGTADHGPNLRSKTPGLE